MKNLTLALDIGTTSVGWTVIDENYNIPEFKGKNLWGVRLFDSASTAEERRTQRGARRRYLRRRRRLELLQLLFQDEIKKIDVSFFDVEAKEDSWLPNKPVKINGEAKANFENKSLTEVYKRIGEGKDKCKNIYFLQKEIIESDKKIDLRLLYLAIYSNVKYRGHFLNEFNFMEYKPSSSLKDDISEYTNIEDIKILESIRSILLSSDGKKLKKDKIKALTGSDKILLEKLYLLTGGKVDVDKIVTHDEYKGKKFSITLTDEEPFKEEYTFSDEDMEMLLKAQNIYLNIVISKILGESKNLCTAQVKAYKIFNNDLKIFKDVIKEYNKEIYKDLFKKHGLLDNYLYGKDYSTSNEQKLSKEDAYKSIAKIINNIKVDDKRVRMLQEKLENEDLFLKQRSKLNAATPHQLKAKDVYDMLNKQRQHYEFIDDEFINKVVTLITYRIPYYVGPLIKTDSDSEFGWLNRKDGRKITPWNIDDIIDKDVTAKEFIDRMIKRCSFLYNVEKTIDNKSMPLDSLTYQLFKMYNELNGIRIIETAGAKPRLLTLKERSDIIEKGFKQKKKVDIKLVRNLLGKNDEIEIIGMQDKDQFASNLSTYLFFKNFLDNPLDYVEEIDKIVRILAVFNDDRIIERQLKKISICGDNLSKIKKLKVSGWGKVSEYLLKEIKSDGKSIIDYLTIGSVKEVINLQKLVTSENYEFKNIIENLNKSDKRNIKYEDVENLAGSPSLKRGIWQTLLIVDELVKKHKLDIKNISIEFAGGDEKKERSKKFEDQIKEISKNCKEHRELINNTEIDYKTINQKTRLYLLQQGKCLYSGEPILFDKLKTDEYEIDHIRARSFTKDNSIDNLALVKRKYNQQKFDDKTPLEIISPKDQYRMKSWWKLLLNCGAISQIKFQRLLKESYSDIELNRFLQRTIVETRQIGKHVKEILTNTYDDIKIYNISSHFTDAFRKKIDLPKVRDLTIKHHCEDAYMLAVVTKYTLDKYGEDFFEFGKNNTRLWYSKENKLTTKDKSNIVLYNLTNSDNKIKGISPIEYFMQQMNKNFLRTIKIQYATTNMLWKETNFSPREKTNKYDFELKSGKVVKNNYYTAFLLLIEYDKKSGKKYKRERELVKVDNIVAKECENMKNKYYEMLKKIYPNYANVSVIRKIPIGQLIDDGNRYTIKSDNEKTNFNEFAISNDLKSTFIVLLDEKKYSKINFTEAMNKFEKIAEYVDKNFKYILGNNTSKIIDICEKNLTEETKKIEEEIFKKLVDSCTKDVLGEYLGIEFNLTESQLKTLKYDNQTKEELINEISTIASNGNEEKWIETVSLISKAIGYKIEQTKIKCLSGSLKEIIKAISIGAGRSDTFKIGRIISKLNLSKFSMVHQSPTGIIEYQSKTLDKISKDKKINSRC